MKLTYTLSAAGTIADMFISVCGLTEAELPSETCPSGLLAIQVEGLCVGGGGVTVGNKSKGWIVFVRSDPGNNADEKRYKFYRDNVLLPFIRQSRCKFDGWQVGSPIREEDQVVSWCDGDLSQVKTIVSPESLTIYADNKICANKQSAA